LACVFNWKFFKKKTSNVVCVLLGLIRSGMVH